MPRIGSWDNLPVGVREHLVARMHDCSISLSELNQLRLWIESKPELPDGEWYKNSGSFKICAARAYPKTFLIKGVAKGKSL